MRNRNFSGPWLSAALLTLVGLLSACSPSVKFVGCDAPEKNAGDPGRVQVVIGKKALECTPAADGDVHLRLDLDKRLGLRVGAHDLQREGDLVRLPLAVLLADAAAAELGEPAGLNPKKLSHTTQLAVIDDGKVVEEIRLLARVETGLKMPARALAQSLQHHDISSGPAQAPAKAVVFPDYAGGVLVVGEPKSLREIDWVVVEDRQPVKPTQCGPYVVAPDPMADPQPSAGPSLGRMIEVPLQVSTIELFDARTGERLRSEEVKPDNGCPTDIAAHVGVDTEHYQSITVRPEQLLAWVETQRPG
ncbi:hypothetical protein [Enhygromyxa salina]|uniref:hypothetical protein n=1 Tax=Enhygromyxa salina TaxID=215803 RepID=UPI0011B2903C|nr:hypothetical protein [Enhygromyxa salina]